MPDRRRQRGAHPKDAESFAEEFVPILRSAVADLSWLLSHGYAHKASTKLVGDRYLLRDRQRKALQSCSASEASCALRRQREVTPPLDGRPVAIDGYNVLLTVEAALSGGLVLVARDGLLRDIASLSRHYRQVETTVPALEAIGHELVTMKAGDTLWYLDRPISNSGRLKGVIREIASSAGWPWTIELVASPDRELRHTEAIVATADSGILDHCGPWVNLARRVVDRAAPDAWIIDLS